MDYGDLHALFTRLLSGQWPDDWTNKQQAPTLVARASGSAMAEHAVVPPCILGQPARSRADCPTMVYRLRRDCQCARDVAEAVELGIGRRAGDGVGAGRRLLVYRCTTRVLRAT